MCVTLDKNSNLETDRDKKETPFTLRIIIITMFKTRNLTVFQKEKKN